ERGVQARCELPRLRSHALDTKEREPFRRAATVPVEREPLGERQPCRWSARLQPSEIRVERGAKEREASAERNQGRTWCKGARGFSRAKSGSNVVQRSARLQPSEIRVERGAKEREASAEREEPLWRRSVRRSCSDSIRDTGTRGCRCTVPPEWDSGR